MNEAVNGSAPPRQTLWVIVALCGLSITFDGYDLVVFGTTVPSLLKEWQISPAEAGTLASLALVGMLIGALLVGTLTDVLGRRKMLLLSVTWFSVSMMLCTVAPSPELFGLFRLLGGLGLGGLMPTAAALVIEYAPPGRANLTYGVMQSGYAIGGILAAALAIPVIPDAGWRVMYLIGAAPLLLVVPLAYRLLPESLEYLVLRGRREEASELAARHNVPLPERQEDDGGRRWYSGVRELVSPGYRAGTVLLWATCFCALLAVYGLSTWLPQIMRTARFPLGSALTFLLVFNLGSIVGSVAGGRIADRVGSKPVVTVSFLLGAASVFLLATRPSTWAMYLLLAVAGHGTIGTQNLVNAYVTRYYPAGARTTGIGWALGVGRLGAILGPTIGGLVIDSGAPWPWNFYLFAAVALVGLFAAGLVPQSPSPAAERSAGRGSRAGTPALKESTL
ncbi:MFS transporter [Streptomyces glebosus]|uniref:MFS transporter n=1 Tax=Streptomyces glebosus TaxID=249580 RepID=UPI00167E1566|nr:aromatic acid/H+ symport family MFS transporter [Streptomyces glebosus]GHG78665.1 MFS transporter [Streptomyces glebosus]